MIHISPHRLVSHVLLVAFLLAIGSVVATASDDRLRTVSILALTRATLIVADAPVPPNPDIDGWQPVTLPDWWDASRYQRGRQGWYRIPIPDDVHPTEAWGVYLPRLDMNARLYFNGQFIAADGHIEDPMSRGWNRPFYATLPSSLWQPGNNVLEIHLKSDPNHGYLAPVRVGSEKLLKAEFEWRMFYQSQLSAILSMMILAVAALNFALWLKRRKDRIYLWFSLSCFGWAGYSLNMFVRDIPVPTLVWEWFTHSAVIWWTVMMVLFLLEYTGKLTTKKKWGLLVFLGAAVFNYALSGIVDIIYTAVIWSAGCLLLGFYIVGLLAIESRRTGNRTFAMLAITMGIVLLAGIHDWLMQAGVVSGFWSNGFLFSHYTAPLVFFIATWDLIERFITALNNSELLTAELEDRVAAAKREIEANHQHIEAMLQREAIATERHRVARDIHDGLGGHFANAIMLTSIIGRERLPEPVSDRLKRLESVLGEGLSELRYFITTLSDGSETVGSLADFMAKKIELLQGDDAFCCAFEAELGDRKRALPASQLVNLARMFQEILTNTVKHSCAHEVRVYLGDRSGKLVLRVTDDGIGFDMNAHGNGHGLDNLRFRADDIGAQLEIDSKPGEGTRTLLTLPIDQAA